MIRLNSFVWRRAVLVSIMQSISEATTHPYEALLSKDSSDEANAQQNVLLQPPAYNTSPATQPWNVPPEIPQWILAASIPQTPDSSSPFYKTFLKGKPLALGIVLIVSAILQISLGVALFFTWSVLPLYSGITFWGSVFYIISGALSIAARAKPNICLVKGSLSLNIISSIVSGIALILCGIDLAIAGRQCFYSENYDKYTCGTHISVHIMDALLIVTNLLVFSVTLSLSIFGCRSLSNLPSNVTQVFVMQNAGSAPNNTYTAPPSYPSPPQPWSPYGNVI